jgi:hypothetical protein
VEGRVERVPTYRPTLAEALGDDEPNDAEEKVLAAAKAGEVAEFGEDRPEEAVEGRTIRAELIRFLLLGGDDAHPVHPIGVQVQGAWVVGRLDFENCETHLDLWMQACGFAEKPVFCDAHLGALFLPDCAVPGLDLHRLRTEGNVHINDGFRSIGTVDLGGARIGGQSACTGGRFEGPEERAADGTTRVGTALNGNAMTVGADVFLRTDDKGAPFHATGEVNLVRAAITGQLDCTGGRFDGAGGRALDCNAMTVGADVFLSTDDKDAPFHATGEVNLGGATITGQLACEGGRFDGAVGRALNGNAMTVGADVFLSAADKDAPFHATGEVNLGGAAIAGHLACEGGRFDGAFDGQEMRVEAGFFWRGIEGEVATLDLTEAEAGVLVDDARSWRRAKVLFLGGFRYGGVQSRMTVDGRLHWLGRNFNALIPRKEGRAPVERDFDPQPYSELAKAYDVQGHRRAAARVLYERERRLRRAEHARAHARLDGTWAEAWRSIPPDGKAFVDWLFRVLFGYGHKPMRAFVWSLALVSAAALFHGQVYRTGQMAPNSDVILTSVDWLWAVEHGCPLPADRSAEAAALREGCTMPLFLWAGDGDRILPKPSAVDYETFSAGLYGLDLFVPLDALGQEQAWAPSKDRGGWGRWGFRLRWLFQAAGWVITAMGAAVLTGLVGRKE